MALRVDADKGLVLLTVSPYDETIVDAIRTLPQRRYRPDEHDWILPARREQLRALCVVIAELSERGIEVDISDAADGRLARSHIGWGTLRDGELQIAGPYSARRVAALRALPERRFDPDRNVWMLPLTRAGALDALALAGEPGGLVITDRARRALRRAAAPADPTESASGDEHPRADPTRRSPIAHWRHFTSVPVFDNPARERIHVPGVGLCVRVRVNPRRPPDEP